LFTFLFTNDCKKTEIADRNRTSCSTSTCDLNEKRLFSIKYQNKHHDSNYFEPSVFCAIIETSILFCSNSRTVDSKEVIVSGCYEEEIVLEIVFEILLLLIIRHDYIHVTRF
jgi:hypothetical protein